MSTRRLAAAAVAVVFSFGLALAQKAADPAALDRIENWTAPPYWLPEKAGTPKPVVAGEDAGFQPQAVEGVPTPALAFTGITPCRIVDTRGNGFAGAYGPPALIAGVPRSFTLTGQCGIPGSAQAVSLNVTVTQAQGPGHIVIYPQDGAQPTVSTLNYVAGQTIANAAVVPLGAGGGITVIAGVSGTELILDTNGYYAPQTVVNTVNGLSGAVTLAQGANISITPAGNTLSIVNTAPAAWRLTGNSGTTTGTNFLGTTDNQAVEVKVNNQRVMRFEPLGNVIGGSIGSVTAGVYSATISGGQMHLVTDAGGTVGGGSNNRAGDNAGTTTDRLVATVGGGNSNTAGGAFATVPGGQSNDALGAYSFAAGRRAKANHDGALVWGDSTNADVASTAVNQFIARATGGFIFYPSATVICTLTDATGWQCAAVSDRNVKQSVAPVDGREALARLLAIPIQTWSYADHEPAIRHMGPMAQDFAAAYGLGPDDKTINPVDANGVALAAIQGLYEVVREKECEIEALKTRLSKLENRAEQRNPGRP